MHVTHLSPIHISILQLNNPSTIFNMKQYSIFHNFKNTFMNDYDTVSMVNKETPHNKGRRQRHWKQLDTNQELNTLMVDVTSFMFLHFIYYSYL